ncbi:nicotinamide riboside transporter PnuC [Thiomicrorhabdus sp. 6S3-12]|uniref:nicotinamide riboside transporter PnuC n=1 Tax=Thiomicrorhabdus sp. 6S3-12 TaxID=2819681 RepID=UPI001AACEFCD|nr:nicotinamide riboside transporter PnuC [Thiomicrorhabdus sp. 6S3-12]MBO1923556.1 nicotinamide mononucleotide transporter [Thiomicrorhabdus sp. 6S3-12]
MPAEPLETHWLEQAFYALLAQSGWEWLAVALGIGYVILAANNSKWAWPSAFFSTLIYTFLFWDGQLPMQALLNAYYLLMAVYGFWLWNHSEKHPSSKQTADSVSIHRKSLFFHLSFIAIGITLSALAGIYLQTNNYSQLPYLDAFVTVFSVMNTVLMARKVIENWLYWIVIDSLAIYLYWESGFYVTIVMFGLYLVLALYGYREWKLLANR